MNRPLLGGFATQEQENIAKIPRAPPKRVSTMNEAYTLSEFTNTFDLPQTVRVVEGCHGPSAVSKDTVLLLCCQKTKKVLFTVDVHQETHGIPCDSAYQYAALDTLYGFEGHVYNSVSELLNCSKLPKVVHIDASTASDLYLNNSDQLIFPYQKDQDILGMNCLVCYDQRNTKFKFSAAKRGMFSTKPDDIKMDISSCIKHIREFPYSIAKYNSDRKMFPMVDTSILTVTGTGHKQNIMAKIMSGVGIDDTTIIEIPLDTPIKVQCLQTNGLQKSENGSSSFQNLPYMSTKPRMPLPEQYMTLTNASVHVEPTYEHLTGENRHQIFPKQEAVLQTRFPTPEQRKRSALINAAQSQFHTSEHAMTENCNNTTITPSDEYMTPLIPYEQPQQFQQIQRLEASNRKLLMEVAQLQACVNGLVHLVVAKNPENNIKQLSTLDTDAVVVILQAMGLSEYEQIFREKEINGKRLANLNRKKLLRYGITDIKGQEGLEDLIKGKVSPLTYLLRLPSHTSADSYAKFSRKLNH